MNNIFENAKFGDKFITRDGRKAIYTMMSCDSHWLAIQDTSFTWEYNNNGELVSNIDNAMDIVAEWQEPIDEEKLNRLARDFTPFELLGHYDVSNGEELITLLINIFKAGYRKALEK